MIFKNILNEKTALLQPEFDRFFLETLANQSHTGDLLLIQANGFYHAEALEWTNLDKEYSPYVIGPNHEGHSEALHHKFIGKYIKDAISNQPYEEYKKLHEWSAERQREIEELAEIEADTVQKEMLIYLKIWEGDLFIKKFYQLIRLNAGLEYDWHFSISQSSRDKKSTGTREYLIRKEVRDKLQEKYPLIYSAIKNAYKTQVRNSIGHSNYSIHGRYIHLNNLIKEDIHSQIEVVPFDEWVDIIHDTLVIYTQQTRILNAIDEFYDNFSGKSNGTIEVRINRKYPTATTEYRLLKQRSPAAGWYWESNDHNS